MAGRTTAETPTAAPPVVDDTTVVEAVIADYETATTTIRDTAKWFTTSAAALGALLVGTSPLAGIGKLTGPDLRQAVLWGAVALFGLAWSVVATSKVLAPTVVEFERVVLDAEYAGFREQVRAAHRSYFGGWASSVPSFARRREELFASRVRIRARLEDPATTSRERPALESARAVVDLNLRRSGWIVERLLAAADHHVTWARFTSARRQSAVAVVLVVAGIVGFLATAASGDDAAGTGAGFDGPLPARVALTEAGRATLAGVLGADCPTDDFRALLTSGGPAGPWGLTVVDPACTNAVLQLTDTQGIVLVPTAAG